MKHIYKTATTVASSLLLSVAFAPVGQGQIVPDATLPNNSMVTPNSNVTIVEGGTTAGGNLFHSFSEFSVPTGREAFFNNATSIDNILTRVTGGKISNIDGLIRANGSANLFLINPNGIIFGPNARLDIGGSFLGSSAQSIVFNNGRTFSATNPEAPPLLTINVPLGLQFGQLPGAIQVNDAGQEGFDVLETFSTVLDPGVESLQVETGQTLALIGGNIDLTGGLLAAPQGRIELGSVAANTLVGLQAISGGYALDYRGVNTFGDIRIIESSAVDASGNGGGDIQIQGRQVRVSDNSFVLGNTRGREDGGTVIVRASDLLSVIGGSGVTRITSSVAPNATGNGGQVLVEADRLQQIDAGQIGSGTFGEGDAGSVTIHARDIELSGALGRFPTNITSPTGFGLDSPIGQGIKDTSRGHSGNISIVADRLRLSDGAQISAITFIAGNAGRIEIVAEQMEIVGINEETQSISGVFSTVNPGAVGQGGDIVLNVDRLLAAEGGAIASSSEGMGDAGNVAIRAAEIEVREVNRLDSQFVSRVESRVVADAVGSGGRIVIETDSLRVRNGGEITVSSTGTGDAGNLNITADLIDLDAGGRLSSEVRSGSRGNITLNTDSIQIRGESSITTNAMNEATGGNITIDTETLALINNSSISANAERGAGGNVQITVEGIFVSPDSSITATSERGIDGVVSINNPDLDATTVVKLPENVVDPSNQLSDGCAAARSSSFTVTGRGGLPPLPSNILRSDRPWADIRNIGGSSIEFREVEPVGKSQRAIVEANTWIVHDDGTMELVFDSQVHQAQMQAAMVRCNGSPLNTRQDSSK